MGTGYFLVRGDKATCGGKIIEGADDHTIMGIPQARDMDRVTCGRYPGMFIIVGGVPETDIHGRLMAGWPVILNGMVHGNQCARTFS